MGLYFYPKHIDLPADHCIHEHIENIPDRFEKQKLLKDWTIEGPFFDEDDAVYYFMLSCRTTGTHTQHSIPEDDFLFNERAVNVAISQMIAECMEIEFSTSTAQRLMGASEEDVNTLEGEDTYIIGDYSRGSGEVTRRQRTSTDEAASSEKPGGLILPP